MKTCSQRDVDHILEKVKNIQKQFNESLSIQIEKLSNLEPLSNDKISNEEITCDSFIPGDGKWFSPRCRGTKEYETCTCDGVKANCDFYPLVRSNFGEVSLKLGEKYYYIGNNGFILSSKFEGAPDDFNRIASGNCFPTDAYCKDSVGDFQLRLILNHRLEIYARQHHALATHDEVVHSHTHLWWVTRNAVRGDDTDYPSVPLFNDFSVAEQALEDVVKPFLKDNPTFIW